MTAPTLDDRLGSIFYNVETMTANLDDASVEEVVEIGAALATLTARIDARLKVVKTRLRNAAESDGLTLGTIHYKGTRNGKATVTIPKPSVNLGKDADVKLLRQVLGEEFSTYFEERTSYKVRTDALDSMQKIASTDRRDLVLKHVEVKDSTPRVSLHRV